MPCCLCGSYINILGLNCYSYFSNCFCCINRKGSKKRKRILIDKPLSFERVKTSIVATINFQAVRQLISSYSFLLFLWIHFPILLPFLCTLHHSYPLLAPYIVFKYPLGLRPPSGTACVVYEEWVLHQCSLFKFESQSTTGAPATYQWSRCIGAEWSEMEKVNAKLILTKLTFVGPLWNFYKLRYDYGVSIIFYRDSCIVCN